MREMNGRVDPSVMQKVFKEIFVDQMKYPEDLFLHWSRNIQPPK